MKKIQQSLLALLLFFPLIALANVTLKPGHPQQYTVKPGDTLWGIANMFLQKPWEWKAIWHANPHIKNPDRLLPGSVIVLRNFHGQPSLMMTHRGSIRLSPNIRKTAVDSAIPPIPLSIIKPFLDGSQVLDTDSLKTAPYVVAYQGEHIAGGEGNHVYVKGLHARVGDRFSVYRDDGYYRDDNTKEILGYAAEHVGEARVTQAGNPATLMLTDAVKEVHPGDRLLPTSKNQFEHFFILQAPRVKVSGHIMRLMNTIDQGASNQVVVIDKGIVDNLHAGDVLAIYQKGDAVPDPTKKGQRVKLPDERVGELMVFQPFSKVSLALVMRTSAPIYNLDSVRNP